MITIENEVLNLSKRDGPQYETYLLNTSGDDEVDLISNAIVTVVGEAFETELDIDHCDANIQEAVAIKCRAALIEHQIAEVMYQYDER